MKYDTAPLPWSGTKNIKFFQLSDTKLLTFKILVIMVAKIRLHIEQNIAFVWDMVGLK